jgi:hypothetical protein
MNVRVDQVFEEGSYRAILDNVEPKDTKFGERLMWTFRLLEKNAEVVGFTSMSPSTKANAYRWAEAIMGDIDPKIGWGADHVIDGECVVVLEVTEDAQGIQKNKVVKVKPSQVGIEPDGEDLHDTPL